MFDLYKSDFVEDASFEVVKEGNCTIIKISDETGDGVMTEYELFEGVSISYNDFHMHFCKSTLEVKSDILCIDHCKEGKVEHNIKDDVFAYTGTGDLKIDTRKNHKGDMIFPLNHYHGITIYIDIDKANKSLKEAFPYFEINIKELKNKFCPYDKPYIISNLDSIEHIFHELYSVPKKIRRRYMILKVLEILLFLEALEITEEKKEPIYFYKTQVEKVKAMHEFMIEHLDKHYTLNELSEKFNISLTIMKKCFKSIYGDSIFSYMRTYKMNQAAVYLKTRKDLNICDIAGILGYESPGKFSTAFKNVIGITPFDYKKKTFRGDCCLKNI